MTGPRLFTPRWLAAGGAVVLAAVIGVALLLQNGGSACAAPPSTSAKSGKATFYRLSEGGDGGTGNCSFPSLPSSDLYVALGPDQYSAGAACGTYLDVTGPKGKVRVKVTDSCPECAAGHLDLSRTAFRKIADEVQGIVPITYKTVAAPTVPGPISVTIKDGSSAYWLAVLIDNHGSRLTSVKVAGPGGEFRSAKRFDYNYWIIEGGIGGGPFKIKIADAYGKSASLPGIKLSAGNTQKTSVRLGGSGTLVESAVKSPPPSSVPAKKKKSPSAAPATSSATPSTSPSVSVSVSPSPSVEPATTAAEVTPTEAPVDLAAATPACGS
ncbi:expansin EXLX1 family cellulose-binding protein [Micromonosporaceae bacterium Da 78-11]